MIAAALVLSACSVTQSLNDLTKVEYRTAQKTSPLELPPDMVAPRRDDRFVLPDRPGNATTTFSAYSRERTADRPAGTGSTPGVLPDVKGARIERQGTQRWLVVDQSADKVWPVVRGFWLESGFALRVDSPETGVLETDWAENRPAVPDSWLRNTLTRVLGSFYVTGERDKFRTRLESDGKTTEIFVSHRGLSEEFVGAQNDRTVWMQRPNDPELEAEFLRRLMLRLSPARGADMVASAASQPGTAAASTPVAAPAPKAALIELEGRPHIRVQEGFDRAWRQVGLALDRTGFTVEDRDRSKGTFFVRYVDPQQDAESKGIFSRVFGTGESRDLSARRYRIVVADDQPGSRVGVLDGQGNPPATEADRRVAGQIVALLQEQLK